MKEQQIFVVIEQGNGFVHSAHTTEQAAKEQAEKLMYETNFENFEVQELTLFIS
jgi:hypothetical protein